MLAGLDHSDRLAVRGLRRVIEDDWDSAALEHVAAGLRSMLASDMGVVYRLGVTDGKTHLEFSHQSGGPAAFHDVLRRYAEARSWTEGSAAYDPVHPARDQRNVVCEPTALVTEAWRAASVGVRELMRPLGLHDLGQLRILVCDGPVFLGWFGVMSSSPFREKDRVMLGALTRPLVRRMRIDKRLRDAQIDARVRDVALEALGAPAFILRDDHLLHANEPGRRLLDSGIDLYARIRAARAGADQIYTRWRSAVNFG